MEEGVATVKAEVVDGVNKVQADVSESVTNGIEQVRERVCFLGKPAHFCPTPSLVPTSFGGHSDHPFPSRMSPNDPRTRKEVRMTGTKKGMT